MKALFHCRHSAYTEVGFSLKSVDIHTIYTEVGFTLESGFTKIVFRPKFPLLWSTQQVPDIKLVETEKL